MNNTKILEQELCYTVGKLIAVTEAGEKLNFLIKLSYLMQGSCLSNVAQREFNRTPRHVTYVASGKRNDPITLEKIKTRVSPESFNPT